MTDPEVQQAIEEANLSGRINRVIYLLQREHEARKRAEAERDLGHARLNETRVKDVAGDLYTRISAIIQLLADDNSEIRHNLLATGAEKDAAVAKMSAAEHRALGLRGR